MEQEAVLCKIACDHVRLSLKPELCDKFYNLNSAWTSPQQPMSFNGVAAL
jgi:hypothetical protein